jgi:rfaE bifunctional protein kinase chain/domain
MVKLTGILNQIRSQRVLVAGDLMLDTYTLGKARRISPEAPVAVVHVQSQEHRPGGAGNVALNLVSLGADVLFMGRVGNDPSGQFIKNHLEQEAVECSGIYTQDGYQTPVKNRVLADNQQVVRVDHEVAMAISTPLEQAVIDALPKMLEGVQVVAISDYGKGFLSRRLLSALISESKKRRIPVIADPKGVDFSKYSGTTVLKPNLGEFYAAANLPLDLPLEMAAKRIFETVEMDYLAVTRSEAGVSVFQANGTREDFPSVVRQVKDVTGAGDTALATIAYALANDLSMSFAVQLANVTAGMAVERFGCARITLSELARRLLENNVSNKIFDEEHVFALKAALEGRSFNILSLSDELGMTSSVFSAIRQLAGSGNELLIYLSDSESSDDFVNLLASLNEVSFILLRKQTLSSLCSSLPPQGMYVVNVQSKIEKIALNSLIDEQIQLVQAPKL